MQDQPRAVPVNLEAEMCVLGCIMLDRASLDRPDVLISRKMFYAEKHRTIFEELKIYDPEVGEPISVEELAHHLKLAEGEDFPRCHLEKAGGIDYLRAVQESVSDAENIAHYARIVREKYLARRLMEVVGEILGHTEED